FDPNDMDPGLTFIIEFKYYFEVITLLTIERLYLYPCYSALLVVPVPAVTCIILAYFILSIEPTHFITSLPHQFTIQRIPRGLEVCQSWSSSLVTTLNALLYSSLVFRPDMVLCNSSGTCVPLCDAGAILGLKMVLIVYVERICRVESLSLCRKILYPLRLHTTFSLCYKWEHFALKKNATTPRKRLRALYIVTM
uniref:UDP-N-acetylglucosamine transferase subunit ALG14 n=1 Tax=Hucho hucho TaxID=62062 RepID=A0A4W5LXL3_9TELE